MITQMKKFNRSFLYSVYLFVLLPAVVILPFSVISTMYFKGFYEDSIQQQYAERLESVYNQNETNLQSIGKNVRFLEADEVFMQVMRGGSGETQVRHAGKQLKQFTANYPLIESAFILDRSSGRVYTSKGDFALTDFLGTQYIYAEYDAVYWRDYRNPLSEKQILPPSAVATEGEERMVMPMVFTRIGETYISNLLIINVSMDYIFSEMERDSTEFQPMLGIVNKYVGVWFEQDGKHEVMSTEFMKKIMPDGLSIFDHRLAGTDSLVVAYSPNRSILGYSYVAGIPRAEINGIVYNVIWVLIVVWILLFGIILLITHFAAKTLYAPVRGIMELILPDKREKESEFASIQTYIRQTMKMKETYLPIVQENLLVEFLSNNDADPSEAQRSFAENGLTFSKPFFAIVLLRLRPTAQYYKEFADITYENMVGKLLDVLCPCFPETYDIYSLTTRSDSLCLVLNVDASAAKAEIEAVLCQFASYLEPDKQSIRLRSTVGDIHEGLEGMKLSFREAEKVFDGITTAPDTAETERSSDKKRRFFGDGEESVLANHLLAGQVQLAREYINAMIAKERERDSSAVAMYNLYVRITQTLLNSMRLRQIPFEGQRVDDIDIPVRFFNLPPEELRSEIEKMLDAVEEHIIVSRVNVEKVIAYIQEHYNEDLRLDELADKYGVSSSYLSRALRDGLGMTFSEYTGKLRVSKAKELLETTDLSVTEIGEIAGFSNRNAFTRTFKMHTGGTPSQYRTSIGK